MTDAPLPSAAESEAERQHRWSRTRRFLEDRGLDGLLAFSAGMAPGPDQYLSNDLSGRHVVFPREGDPTATVRDTNYIAAHMVSEERGEHGWIADVRTGMSGQHLAAIVREKGLADKRIGVVGIGPAGPIMPAGWVPWRAYNGFTGSLPDAELVDVTWDFLVHMLERTAYDHANARRAAWAGEEACKAMVEVARPGVDEVEVFSAGMDAFNRSGVRSTWMILHTGSDNLSWGEKAWHYRPQRPRVLAEGDVLSTELFPYYGTVEAQQQLACAIGDVHPDFDVCAGAARAAYDAGLAALKPGVTFGQLCDAMHEPVDAIGGWNLTPMVHTVNPLLLVSRYAVDIAEHVPELGTRYPGSTGLDQPTGADVELRAGMTLAFEPNACLGRHRVNIGGTVIVTDDGYEELNDFPNRLQHAPAG